MFGYFCILFENRTELDDVVAENQSPPVHAKLIKEFAKRMVDKALEFPGPHNRLCMLTKFSATKVA
jgi:hypothetical protein